MQDTVSLTLTPRGYSFFDGIHVNGAEGYFAQPVMLIERSSGTWPPQTATGWKI